MEARKTDDSYKKRARRRCYTRKAPLINNFINMAEARREIVNALHLHRSNLSPSPPARRVHTHLNQKYYNQRQLTESIPNHPEPTWSTTAPAVLCAPVPTVDVLEVEWFDNISASHSWWIGFLSYLDGKINEVRRESMEGLGPCLVAPNIENLSDASDADDQATFLEEWVVLPAGEKNEEQV
ncbi:hypothetical protein CASFOL_026166 [Castilleja foliolosa]|uniref:Uncharacterized protein n=1 Tax=Castilleja foliolosa TaxID=1961234 RepID=A0ABD3CKV7_9LAMI